MFNGLNLDSDKLNYESLEQFNNDLNTFVGQDVTSEFKEWQNGTKTFEELSTESQNLVSYISGLKDLLSSSGLDDSNMATALNQIMSLGMNANGDTLWIQQVAEIITGLGGQVEGGLGVFMDLQTVFSNLTGSTPDFSGLISQLIQIQSILSSLKSGDAVDIEIALKLISAGFGDILSPDGSGGYYVSGDPKEASNTAESMTAEAYTEAKKQQSSYNTYQKQATANGNTAMTSVSTMADVAELASTEEGAAYLKEMG